MEVGERKEPNVHGLGDLKPQGKFLKLRGFPHSCKEWYVWSKIKRELDLDEESGCSP